MNEQKPPEDVLDRIISQMFALKRVAVTPDVSEYTSAAGIFNSLESLMEYICVKDLAGLVEFCYQPGVELTIKSGLIKLSIERRVR